MAKRESTQHKLDRVRSPAFRSLYDVEVNGAMQLKELPFVMGVLGRFFRQPRQAAAAAQRAQGSWKSTGDNFDKVLAGMTPRLLCASTTSCPARRATNQHRAAVQQAGRFRSRKTSSSKLRPCGSCWKRANKLQEPGQQMEGNDKLESQVGGHHQKHRIAEKMAKSLGARWLDFIRDQRRIGGRR